MSAFVVSHKHINVLLSYLKQARVQESRVRAGGQVFDTTRADDLQRMAEVLYAQNVRSVHARYPNDEDVSTLPGIVDEVGTDIHFRFEAVPMPSRKVLLESKRTELGLREAQVLKLCNCYDYQSCETGDYEKSLAFKIIQAIKETAIRRVPGYEAAEWEV